MIPYTMTEIGGTRLEAIFWGRRDKWLLGVRGRRIFMDFDPDLFQVVVDYLKE